MRVSVIVLNWDGKGFVEECISSLLSQSYRDFELLVVDNGSTDGSREWLEENVNLGYRLIENERNFGYAGGNNIGIREAKGEWVALVNNDVSADKLWLEELMKALDSEELANDIGMLASKVIFYGSRDLIDNTGHLIYPDGLNRGRERLKRDDGNGSVREALFPSGCAGLYRKAMLDEVGYFDERFFAYGDDADIGLRGRLLGWRCLYVPRARVYHRYSMSAGAYSPFKAYHVERNRVWVMLKTFPSSMIWESFFYTFVRYCLQAWGALSGRGAAGAYTRSEGRLSLVKTLVKSQWDAWRKARQMLKERKTLWERARLTEKEMEILLKKNRLGFLEVSLYD